MSKTPLPPEVNELMAAWRARGHFGHVPSKYVSFHQDLARAALNDLVNERKLTLHNTYEADDGWFSGMKVVWAIVEEPGGRLVKLSWSDSNQEFFEHNHGSWPYRLLSKTAT